MLPAHLNYKISNIKISFQYFEKIFVNEKVSPYLNYHSKNIHIIKFDQYTACLMRGDTFCNLTGVKNIIQLLECLKKICLITNIIESNIFYKVDTITVGFDVQPGLKQAIIEQSGKYGFIFEVKLKFCGLCLRHNVMDKAVLIYFQSGKCNLLGSRSFEHVKRNVLFIKNFLNKI